jgi:lipopolysaccharide transport system ATP-binding protein
MSQPVISVTGLGKRYYLSHQKRSDTLRDTLTEKVRSLGRQLTGRASPGAEREEFWALRDVSFEIKQGEVVGIIGRNGAGKSTLLKILSRITEPTTGRVGLRGRVASLLEVGTGFHPELSGRENIYLNGAILGMSRAEITRKFDEIVAFAQVEKFLDTQVKHYSSGMYVRLAFAVAAHLEPEILIVDEVLAVGDVAFQKKCLGKMESISRREGRTVLFVSHNLSALRQLCPTSILLKEGRVEIQGPTPAVLNIYARAGDQASQARPLVPPADLLDRGYLLAVALEDVDGNPLVTARVGESWQVRVRVRLCRPMKNFVAAIGLVTNEGVGLQTAWSEPRDLAAGDYEYTFRQNAVALAAGSYGVVVGLSESDQGFQQEERLRLEISGENPIGYCAATSGYGLVLNSMQITMTPCP